jgi:cyclopropane fatty-acyl-phospholipid synthase-like methyltransferase
MRAKSHDAFGQWLLDQYEHGERRCVIERNDGCVDDDGEFDYFAPYAKWPKFEKEAIRLAKGKTLDIGCGAGRVLLHLQEKGLKAVGIDVSPLAREICRRRGAKDTRLMSISQLSRKVGIFDTIVMYGNNFGLFGNPKRAKWLLKKFYGMTSPDVRIIAETVDPYKTTMKGHLEYHKANRAKGKLGGELKLRIRHKKYIGDWFEYLFVSKKELQQILEGTGWRVKQYIESGGPIYIVVMEKAG